VVGNACFAYKEFLELCETFFAEAFEITVNFIVAENE
jgi:hypothetical protein